MMVPPLSQRPVTDEDEEQFRRESAPRKYTLRRRWADYRAEVKARRPKGARARARAWLHVEPFYWGMRVVYVALFAGAVFAVYINGVAEGWWPAWGERPTVAATTPPINPHPLPRPQPPPKQRCPAATKSAPMASSYAPPNTQHPPTPNPNYQKKPNKTQKEEQKQQPNTILPWLPMPGTRVILPTLPALRI